jgi:hypothetical protein
MLYAAKPNLSKPSIAILTMPGLISHHTICAFMRHILYLKLFLTICLDHELYFLVLLAFFSFQEAIYGENFHYTHLL